MPHPILPSTVQLFPRRKLGDSDIPQRGRAPLTIDLPVIQSLFSIPQVEACKVLGVSLTAMKQLCRKLGVSRWPYTRPCTTGRRRHRARKSKPDTQPEQAKPVCEEAVADCQGKQELESASSTSPGSLSEDDSAVEDAEASGGSVVEPTAAEEEVTEGSWMPNTGWIDWYMECGDEEDVSQRLI
mmetsp:Transcript_19250/g.63676  ORF Transcript_19250/g.63676 Transcript_19250/m.63676 type:complete len:184 (-) Transcript_19250:137-688(-)